MKNQRKKMVELLIKAGILSVDSLGVKRQFDFTEKGVTMSLRCDKRGLDYISSETWNQVSTSSVALYTSYIKEEDRAPVLMTEDECNKFLRFDMYETGFSLRWRPNNKGKDITCNLLDTEKEIEVNGFMYDTTDLSGAYHYNNFPVMSK